MTVTELIARPPWLHFSSTRHRRPPEELPVSQGIADIRRRFNLTTEDLAKIAGVSRRTVEGWEQGRGLSWKAATAIKKWLDSK